MNREAAEQIANAVLYEGYMLYPYRPSSLKNQQRWNFGTLYPPRFEEVRRGAERSSMHVECLISAPEAPVVSARVRFLQLSEATGGEWNDAKERSIELQLNLGSSRSFNFPGIDGALNFATESVGEHVYKLMLDLSNETELDASSTREHALLYSMLSAHIIVFADRGEFISLLDPPDSLREAVTACRNAGCFPVLVGEEGQRHALLCSPIILYDYPQVAPESAADFFDATEMDEMLTLRVLTLTPEEKDAMRASDERVRALLERTESTAREQLMRTHGVVRSFRRVTE